MNVTIAWLATTLKEDTSSLPIIASTLIRLMLPHQWDQLLCSPAFRLKVIIIRSRGSSVHHEIDG